LIEKPKLIKDKALIMLEYQKLTQSL